MKKILLVVGLAFGCSSVYAQIVQIGIGNQIGAPGMPFFTPSIVNPASNLNARQLYGNKITGSMHDDQLGADPLTVTIQQRNIGGVAPSMYNFFDIMQSGAGNTIVGDQLGYNNGARLWQEGTTNGTITTSQSGHNNATIIKQLSGSDYTATTRQGSVIPGGAFGSGSNAPGDPFVAPIVGSLTNNINNTIRLEQSGETGSASIIQEGSWSRFDGVQKGGTPFLPNSLAVTMNNLSAVDVMQDGTGNAIVINQLGWQYARAEQNAGTNQGRITINQGFNSNTDTKNTAKVYQKAGDFNQATVTQTDVEAIGNEATITQSGTFAGAGLPATVTVTQTGKYSRAIVTQDSKNSGGVVTINQSEGRLLDGSYAEVTQTGDVNEFAVNSQAGSRNVVMGTQGGNDNRTGIDQEGQMNVATVNQDGSDNEIDIDQENEPSAGVGNKAFAIQAAGTSDSDITINQDTDDGDENVATVNQTRGDDNNATITQYELNTATVTQSGTEYSNAPSTGSNVDIDQSESTGGTATVIQQNGTFGNQVDIEQDEVGNTATVTQTRGRLNETDIFQNDNGNTATVTQGGNENTAGPGATPNTIDIDQNGKGAMATVTQMNNTNGSTVDIDQNDSDIAEVMQANGERLSVDIEQSGANLGLGNVAKTSQEGENNDIEIDQRGNMNMVGGQGPATQKGKNNTATLDQNGSNNMIVMAQDGSNNDIQIDQDNEPIGGAGNTATVSQATSTSDGSIIINQGLGALDGDDNTATVSQTRGDRNFAQVNQLKGNTATITQSGDDADVLNVVSTAIIEQSTSTGGTATITQANGTLGNSALITQTDINNVATINQLAGVVNGAVSIQIGERNNSTINQSGSFNVLTGTPSGVAVAQTGNDNTATATQAAGTQAGIIAIVQAPLLGSPSVNGNVATVNQNAGTGNVALVTQNDDLNKATVTQTGTTDAGSGDNSNVILVQGGKSGDVVITQAADGSNVIATQFNGNRNIQTIDQAKLGRQLDAFTYQGGDDNTLTINQSGQENVGSVVQSNLLLPADPANGPSTHVATLTQGGTVNEAVIGQGGQRNNSNLTQTAGKESFASTLQYGSDNMIIANQTSPLRNNTLNVTQGRVGGGVPAARLTRDAATLTGALLGLAPGDVVQSEENMATVNQTTGENQVINLLQPGDNETATITQAGSDNNNRSVQAGQVDVLTHTQTGSQGRIIASQYGEETDKGNTQTINQGGNNNTADVGQIKFGNIATVTQTGNDNNIVPGSIVRQVGANNTSTTTQGGDRGNIAVIQGDLTGPLVFGGQTLASTGYAPLVNDAFRNTADVTQNGLDNIAGSVQAGDDGIATITQAGQNNTIGIRQLNVGVSRSVFNVATATQTAGVKNSLIDIEQAGRRNNANAEQSGTSGNGNTINLNQKNDDNVAILKQVKGNQNIINVSQNPDAGLLGGRVEITQSGQDNKARLRQTGYENKLTLTQTGDRNVLQQNGGNPFALQGGHNNTATLIQMGEDHTINLNQSGMMNTATVTQMNL